ncbi:MAG: hypothetical protein KAS17_04810 [Victivallaceae bacterium]|nr:hypothetical protein [Victivallaceae bacterium]
MSRYQQIMEHLQPQVLIAKTETPYDTAIANYVLQNSIVPSYEIFVEEIITFTAYVMLQTVGSYPPPEFLLDKARQLLDKSIRFENAAVMALSGAEGGLMAVLQDIIKGFKENSRQAYYFYILENYIDPMSFQQVVEVMQEFKDHLGAYTPEPFDYISAEQMAAEYKTILWNYIESLSRHRNLWSFTNN